MRRKTAAGGDWRLPLGRRSVFGRRRPAGRRFRPRLAAAGLAALLASPAAGQPIFRLGSWSGVSEVRLDAQEQNTDFLLGRNAYFERQVTEGRLALRNTLTVVARNFLTVNYGFTLGLLQTDVTADQDEARGDGELRAFDLTATYRPLSPRRITFLYNSSINQTPVEFVGTRELSSESFGLNTTVGPRWFSGDLRLRQSELRSVSEFGDFLRGLDQMRRTLDYSTTNRWQRHGLFASLRFEDVEDRIAPRFSHRSGTLNVTHSFEVLAPQLATLNSVLRIFDRSGELTSSSFYLDEVLRMRHRKNLSSSVRWVAQQLDSFSGPPSDSQRLFVGLRHQLYESLETDFLAGRTRTSSAGGRTDLDEIGFDSAYRKKLPLDGRLTARIVGRYELRDSLSGGGQELVTDERHVARFGVPARLERPAVLLESVVVTDELRTTIFEEGVDYELLQIGEFVEILPLQGGRIRDGERILVEYRVEAPSLSKFSALRSAFDLNLDYGWIAPFIGYRSVDTRLDEGPASRLFEDQRDQVFGLRLNKSGRRFHLVSFNELRIRDSSIQSFETLRIGESLTYRPFRFWTVRLNLAYLDTRFTDIERQNTVTEGRLRLRWTPLPLMSLEAFVNSRVSEDTVAADQSFDRYGLEARWTLGKITMVAAVDRWRRERLEDGVAIESFEGSTMSLRLSRRFFPGRLSAPRRPVKLEPWPEDLPGLWSQPPPAEPGAEAGDGGDDGGDA